MRLHEEPSSGSDTQAPEIRVPTVEFTRALAEIGARKARQAFDQAGTLTLAEALQETDVEATVEELAEEVTKVREADAVEAGKQKRRHRLRLILLAELASILLCGLTLLSLSRTVYNPQWQASRQIDEMKNALRLTQGPNPSAQVYIVPTAFQPTAISGSTIYRRVRSNSLEYPLSALPDGYNIHHYDVIDDDGHLPLGGAPFMPTFPAHFKIRDTRRPSIHDHVSVFYDGLRYDRGWIRKSDVPNLLHGRPFLYYPEPVDDPQDNHKGLVPLTLSSQSIAEAHLEMRTAYNTGYSFFASTEDSLVRLDEHAWEKF